MAGPGCAYGAGIALVLCLALAPPAAAQQPSVTAARVEGQTRFHTAAELAALTFDQAQTAHLVVADDFPDALASSYAAGAVGGPVLLVPTDAAQVPSPTLQALRDLGVQRTVLVGGPAVLSGSVEQDLRGRGFAVERAAGADRYRTASALAVRHGRTGLGTLDGDRTALLVTGEDFADALAAGPLAAHSRFPLLLTPSARTEPSVDDALQQLGIERLVVVGGPRAVSADVAGHYEELGYRVERWQGRTRQETAVAVAENARRRLGFTAELTVLARGDDFPDALTASSHAAAQHAPILLTATPDALGDAARRWLSERCPDVRAVRAVGGTRAVSAAVLAAAVDAAQTCAPRLAPDRALALDPTAGLVELDAAAGDVLQAYAVDTGEVARSLTYSPARHSALFAREVGGRHEVVELALADRTERVHAAGHAVAVDAGGQRLAVGRHERREDGTERVVLEVRTLAGQVVGRWDDPVRAEEPVDVSHLSWSPDGRRIAFQLAFEDGTEVRVLDVASGSGSLQGGSRPVPASGDLRMLAAPTFRPGSGLLAVVDRPGLDPDARQQWRILTVEADSGAVRDVLVETDRAVAALDFDPTGEHLLYLEGHPPPARGEAPEPPTLLRWHAGGSTAIARGPTGATW